MVEHEPSKRPEVIIEAPFEGLDSLGRSAVASAMTLDLDVDAVISGMELMLAIQEDLPYVEIKEEQVECLDAIQSARSNGADKALIQMATGTGKTTVAAADVKRFLHENPGARVLFLSHQNRIGDQARERFESVLGNEFTYGNFSGEEQDFHEVDCLFASFQAMGNWREAFLEDEFDYVVIDEAHHSKADTYEPTVEYFKPKFMLAMTATPDRHDMKDIRELFGQEVYKLTLEEAIARNLLAYVDYYVMLDEIAAENLLRDPETRKKLSMKQLNRSIFMPMRDEEMVRICNEKANDIDEPIKRLVFCKSIEQTEELAQYYERAAPIHTNLPAWEIKQVLEKYKNGEIETLLTVDMFNEGIDVPEVNQVVFMRLTDSVNIFLQQLGRGLRKIDGKERVQVLDFVANCDRLTVLEAFWKRVVVAASEKDGLTGDVFRINGGEFHFSSTTRDILEVLSDIEANRNEFKKWGQPEAVDYYLRLCESVEGVAGIRDIYDAFRAGKGPAIKRLLAPFEGSLTTLRQAAQIETTAKVPFAGMWKDWTAGDSVRVYQELSGNSPLTIGQLTAELSSRADVPSIVRFLEPFEAKMSKLKGAAGFDSNEMWKDWTAGDSLHFYSGISGGQTLTAEEIKAKLLESPGSPPFHVLIAPFDNRLGNLHKAAGQKNRLMHKEDWSEEDSIRIYQELSGGELISYRDFLRRLSGRTDLPGPSIVLGPFNRRYRDLQRKVHETVLHPDWQGWSQQKSVKAYQELAQGQRLSASELASRLAERDDLPGMSTFLRPFKGRFSELAYKAGFDSEEVERKKKNWRGTDSIRVYQELSGDHPLGAVALREILKMRSDLPGKGTFLQDFDGKLTVLRKSAGYTDKTGLEPK